LPKKLPNVHVKIKKLRHPCCCCKLKILSNNFNIDYKQQLKSVIMKRWGANLPPYSSDQNAATYEKKVKLLFLCFWKNCRRSWYSKNLAAEPSQCGKNSVFVHLITTYMLKILFRCTNTEKIRCTLANKITKIKINLNHRVILGIKKFPLTISVYHW